MAQGATWLSEPTSTGEPTSEPSEPEPSAPSLSPEPSGPSSSELPSASTPSCENSLGVYAYRGEAPGWLPPPEWAESPDGPVCVQLDATSLREAKVEAQQLRELESLAAAAEAEPSTSLATEPDDPLLIEVKELRELLLYAGGLLIFSTAIVATRARKG